MDQDERIAELENALKQRDARIMELTDERDTERALVAGLREQVDDAHTMIDDWIEAFNMTMNDKGEWCWGETLMQRYDDLLSKSTARSARTGTGSFLTIMRS
jgi:hypothetical protein